MVDQVIPLALAALALWSGWTVVRTAIELRRELAGVQVRRASRLPGRLR